MIAREVIDKVRLRADIVSVVSEYCNLQRSGSNLRCCCPFHEEKTPSFFVNVNRNSWHCFGACDEGGDAISFVMKKEGLNFDTAVRKLANKYGVQIEEADEPTTEQRQQALKKEALLTLYSVVQKYYEHNLYSDDPKAKAALEYACERWDKDFVRDMGIGYANSDWQGLINYAKSHACSIELMREVGLVTTSNKNNREHDFFHERLMIPIRNKYQKIIGYTARALNNKDDSTPKYINSKTSEIYKKDQCIFGIDVAWNAASKAGNFVLVEGAPDVMRLQLINVPQAVACLGSQWSDDHFAILKRYSNTLIFVPDADTPKDGKAYGTGIEKVLEAGERAWRKGFTVFVKEIPLGDQNKKQDAGSFFKIKKNFDDLEQQEFIVWYAKKRVNYPQMFNTGSTPVEDVASLLAFVQQEHEIDRYINLLHEVIKGKGMWRKAVTEAKRRQSTESLKEESNTLHLDLFEQYGFQEKSHTYIAISANGKPIRWSNFVLHPLFHIKDNQSALRLFEIENEHGQKAIIEFKQEDLVSLTKFKQKVESLGNYVWLAKEEQLTRLKLYLYQTTETAELITQLGWQKKGFFAFGNGVFNENKWQPVDNFGIARLGEKGNYYLPAFSSIYKDDAQLYQFERSFVHNNWSAITLRKYCERLIEVFGDNAKIGICFLLATLFRDVVTAQSKSFPILNLFGPKGSGKSELGHSLMSFFIIENTPPNIQTSALPALADAVAQCANALVHIDEFKNTIDIDKREFLKGLWDGAGRNRMNMDKDKKREVTRVDSGIILSGQEMATADIALFSRFIFLRYNKSEFTAEAKTKFNLLVDMRKLGCTHLTLQLLGFRTFFEANFKEAYTRTSRDIQEALGDTVIEDRILKNWIIPTAAYACLQSKLDLPFDYFDICKVAVTGIIEQNKELKQNNEISVFWDIVDYLHQDGQINLGADYRIEHFTKLKVEEGTVAQEYATPKVVLLLKYKRIFELYQLHAKKIGETLLPKTSLAYYLENSPAYLGKKKSVRFKYIVQGRQVTTMETVNGYTTQVDQTTVDQAYCFDYAMVKEQYGINLDVSTANINSDIPEETDEEEAKKVEPEQTEIDYE